MFLVGGQVELDEAGHCMKIAAVRKMTSLPQVNRTLHACCKRASAVQSVGCADG